jgi:TRAP transporter TAXI family solute receptor
MGDAAKVYAPLAVLVIVGFAVAAYFIRPAPPSSITMATGAAGGAYAVFGEHYKTALAVDGVDVRLIETEGSLTNIALLAREEDPVDVAFVQGGIGDDSHQTSIVSLASLYPEPVWLFVRADTAIASTLDLKGIRMAIGIPGSGTGALAVDLLSALGYGPDVVERVPFGGADAAQALIAGDVDAALYVGGESSPVIRDLMMAPGIALVPFRRAETFSRLYSFLAVVTLPEGAIDLTENIPPEPVTLLATTANLLARDDLHPAIQSLLLQAARRIHGGGGLFSEPGEFPSTRYVDFPLSTEAERYFQRGPGFLQRYLPFWAANLVQRLLVLLIPLLTLLLPLLRVAPPLYQWRVRRRIYKWYQNVRETEAAARGDASDAAKARAVATLDALQEEVGALKVPLGYAEQLFQLRLHIQFVRRLIGEGPLDAAAEPTPNPSG